MQSIPSETREIQPFFSDQKKIVRDKYKEIEDRGRIHNLAINSLCTFGIVAASFYDKRYVILPAIASIYFLRYFIKKQKDLSDQKEVVIRRMTELKRLALSFSFFKDLCMYNKNYNNNTQSYPLDLYGIQHRLKNITSEADKQFFGTLRERVDALIENWGKSDLDIKNHFEGIETLLNSLVGATVGTATR